MKEEFSFEEGYAGKTVTVHVKKTTVLLHDDTGLITSGLWDAGGYVRYARSSEVAALVHPFLLDKIDQKCRQVHHGQGDPTRARAATRQRSLKSCGAGEAKRTLPP